MPRVLIVEDEKHIADGLRFNLETDGYEVDTIENGDDALRVLLGDPQRFDLIVLDVMLPGKDGFAIVREMRDAGRFVPTLMLTARGRPEDVLRGFEAGADDYLAKPFELAILLARVRGLLRRRQWLTRGSERTPDDDSYAFDGKKIDFRGQELHSGEQKFTLTLMETNLLRYLVRHEGQTVSRKAMLEDVWGVHEDADTRPIDNFIVRLRRYIENEPAKPRHLITVRGVGYRFVAHPGE